ncbi:hypothetical protein MHZ92_19925 [Sporosarcina sp. ACRSL]|uniref:hypothetical protein n=1 Tax=Sporosarcina sp. ACRSL TaxID=2918215 RepID=UPI001EF5BE3A|nr:hypothetical protein [Sporosarcina sp. ACRSL]MCG7346377.1 hypothetical protein [Sporosarcina sp. ACRSL]
MGSVDIEKMKRQIAEWKADRVSRGLSPSPPAGFVTDEHAARLLHEVKPVFDVLSGYATVMAKTGQVVDVDMSVFDPFEKKLLILRYARSNSYAGLAFMLASSLSVIKAAQEGRMSYQRMMENVVLALKAFSDSHRSYARMKEFEDWDGILEAYDQQRIAEIEEEARLEREYAENQLKGEKTQ